MQILVTSDEPDTLERAGEYTTYFATDADITILCVARDERSKAQAQAKVQEISERLAKAGEPPLRRQVVTGRPVPVILGEVQGSEEFDLVVLGVHQHRRFDRLRPKSVARSLAERLDIPLLVVSPAWPQLQRILVWTAGEKPDEFAVHLAGEMAASVGAEVTVLHVMSQIPLTADAETEDLNRDAESLMEHHTREGELFERALDLLLKAGLPADRSQAKVRRGLTVDEIVKESLEGDFDLIVIGALDLPDEESWGELRELVQENLASQVLLEAECPVLIVRQPKGELDWMESRG